MDQTAPESRPAVIPGGFPSLAAAVVLVALGATPRVIEHPWNFAPVAAIALFAGAHFQRRIWGFAIPFAAMALSDIFLGIHTGRGVLHTGMWFVYPSYAFCVLIGMSLRSRRNPFAVAGGAVLSSAFFFLATNFGAWLVSHGPGSDYPKTVEGLLLAYQAGLPFWRGTLVSDVVFSLVLFGAFAFATRCFPAFAERWTVRP